MPKLLSLLRSRTLAVMLPIGFASGLPLALCGGTLQAWLAVDGVDIRTIGLFSLAGLPYTLKFLWSPVMDRVTPPLLGRRRGWMALCQLALALALGAMALFSPTRAPGLLGGLAVLVAFLSASQDIVIDAYRTDILPGPQRGLGAALSITGYRIAMLVSGALALILADRIGFAATYAAMALVMASNVVATLAGPEPERPVKAPASLAEAIVGPLREFFSRPSALALLSLIVLYKLGDAFAGTLTTAFLIRGAGFTPTDVGTINKGMGLVATLGGALLGGGLMTRLGLFRSLMVFGVLQAVSNLAFMILAWLGKNYPMMIAAVGIENIAGGMGTAAFVAFLMALCHHRFTATQYALLSALAAMGRVFVGPPAGYVVAVVGWPEFFFFTTLAAIPGLLVLAWMRERIEGLDAANSAPEPG